MNVSFDGYNRQVLTFDAGASVAVGDLVKMSDNGTVTKAGSGDSIVGVAISVRNGAVGVQTAGYATLSYSGSVSLGYSYLVANGQNKLTPPATAATDGGRQYLVVSKDSVASTIGIILG